VQGTAHSFAKGSNPKWLNLKFSVDEVGY